MSIKQLTKHITQLNSFSSPTTIANCVYLLLPYTGKQGILLSEVMGFSGQAFRINVEEQTVDISGPTIYDWNTVLTRGLNNLGLQIDYMDEYSFNPPDPEKLVEGIRRIQQSIEQGIPAILYDVFHPEFALVYGFDDNQRVFHAMDTKTKGSIPFDKIGQGNTGELYLITVTKTHNIAREQAFKAALEMTVQHARGHEGTFERYTNGLMAYERWIDAFRNRRVDQLGNAYTIEVVYDARKHALNFLNQMLQELGQQRSIDSEKLMQVVAHYQEVVTALSELQRRFPFPDGGSPNSESEAIHGMSYLEKAMFHEESAISVIEKLLS
jgi:hypothetical protein